MKSTYLPHFLNAMPRLLRVRLRSSRRLLPFLAALRQRTFGLLAFGLLMSLSAWAQTIGTVSPVRSPVPQSVTTSQRSAAGSARQMAALAATIRYVKAGASGTGASWSNASGDLQAMINASASGDQVWISGGTYKPGTAGLTNPRTATFSLKDGVSVLGGFTGAAGTEGTVSARTAIPSSTILSGDIGNAGDASDNTYHVVFNNDNALNNSAVLDGVAITGGNANGSRNDTYGGGMFNYVSAPSILNCQFSQNYALNGGAGMCIAFSQFDSPSQDGVRVINCSFQNNAGNGSGIYTQDATKTVITNCFFGQNASSTGGAFVSARSLAFTTSSTLTNCTFSGNTPGAIALVAIPNSTTVNLINCLLWNNGGQAAILIDGSSTLNASYCLIESGETTYTDGGHNQTLTSSPFDNVTGPQLSVCATAIDAGDNSANSTTTDVLGNNRKARQIDIGAAEYQGTLTQPVTIVSQSQSVTTVCGTTTQGRFEVRPGGTGPFTITFFRDNTQLAQTTTNAASSAVTTLSQSGNYQFVVTNACNSVTTTYASITVNPLPTAYNLTGGGAYCTGGTGVTVGLASSQTGINYQLRLNGTAVGNSVAGTGSALSFGNQTAVGTYTVQATNATTACQQAMSGSVSVTVNPLPTAGLINNGPFSCSTNAVTLTASGGTTYRFSNGANQVGSGPTATVSSAGVYSVTVVSGNGCTSVASTTVEGEPSVPPAIISQSQSATTVCAGASVNFSYAFSFGTGGGRADFYRDNTFMYTFETSWGNFTSSGSSGFSINQSGSYQIVVTSACTSVTTTYAPITVNPLPTAYNLTGGGPYCTGGTGVAVDLTGSQTGVNYQLLRDGTAVGGPLAGTGSGLSFGNQTTVGTYTVQATNATTSCQQAMTGSVSVTVNPLPTQYAVTGGGGFCAGEAGVAVGLTESQAGVNYQLLRGGTAIGLAVAGTGSVLSFGNQTTAGTYTVQATSAGTTCQQTMTGSAAVTVNPVPVVSITNPAPVCSPATVSLNAAVSSDIPASFAFFTNPELTTTVANPGAVVTSGTYYVRATSGAGCVSDVKAISLQINALPVVSITGLGSAYCQDATAIPLSGSPTGGSFTVDGTAATQFNPAQLLAGDHSVVYTLTNSNGCSNTVTQMVSIKAVPTAPTLLTRSGQAYPAGQSNLTISQNVGNVVLTASGCAGGTLTWAGGSATTLSVSTASLGTQSFTATCLTNGCTSPLATATVTVVPTTLAVLHRDPDNGQVINNTIKPYLLLTNVGNTPIPYEQISVRYWLTVEDPAPLQFQFGYVAVGVSNLRVRYVALDQPRLGATGYVEYSFSPSAGSLGAGNNSGEIQNTFTKQTYSGFDQRDDHSYVLNRDYTPNARITAYQGGTIVWGVEPPTGGAGARLGLSQEGNDAPSLSIRVLGNPVTGSTIAIEIRGAEGQPVRLQLSEVGGRLVSEQRVERAGAVERQTLAIGQQPAGLLLLRVSTKGQSQTVKILKQ